MEFQPMSPEDMQRTMQFLLSQQAQFAADFDKLTVKTDGIVDAVVGLTGVVGRVADNVDRLTSRVEQLAAFQERTDERLGELGDYIKTVESHLDVVIQMFERHLREDHGRRPS